MKDIHGRQMLLASTYHYTHYTYDWRCAIPTYDYLCEKCDHTEEVVHSMNDDSPQMCPECKSKMQKQIGLGHMIIKGSGDPSDVVNRQIKDREERAKDLRNKPVQRSHEGTGSGEGRALGGQHFEVDKAEFIKAAAKDPATVKLAQEALKKQKQKK